MWQQTFPLFQTAATESKTAQELLPPQMRKSNNGCQEFRRMLGTYDARFRVRSAICFKLRSASFTASESGKASSRSGAIIATFVPCCTRSKCFPRTPFRKSGFGRSARGSGSGDLFILSSLPRSGETRSNEPDAGAAFSVTTNKTRFIEDIPRVMNLDSSSEWWSSGSRVPHISILRCGFRRISRTCNPPQSHPPNSAHQRKSVPASIARTPPATAATAEASVRPRTPAPGSRLP